MPRPADQWLAEARAGERAGQLFKAYDLAVQGLAEHPDDVPLRHRAVLCLARAGATRLAMTRYRDFDLARVAADIEDVAALAARLKKDEALAAPPPDRPGKAAEAAAEYRAIFDRTGGYYPAINAATLMLLAGDALGAAALAADTIAVLERTADRDYYSLATRMEALLLQGDLDQALLLAEPARRAAEGDQAALATTWKQLRLVIQAKHLDLARFATAFAPPTVIHFLGHMIAPRGRPGRFEAGEEAAVRAQIETYLDERRIGTGYGSLASGADIMFAEALLRRGIGMHVVLPFEREDFLELSVRPAGGDWAERFEACLAKASSVRFATDDRYLGDDGLFAFCSRLAMGLARLQARQLGAAVEQVAVWDGAPATGTAGTAADVETWRALRLPRTIIPCGTAHRTVVRAPATPGAGGSGRVVRAMLFCDVKGFSRLNDTELPRYVDHILATLGDVVNSFGDDVGFGNTWGDGLFLVFGSAGRAASCALDLQDALSRLDLPAAGLPPHLAMRIGGHLGPVYAAHDPILRKINYFGAHVSRAARIEPVTPPACVYVTEPFAAALALENDGEFACDYVGVTESAKHYGAMPMFLLRRAGLG